MGKKIATGIVAAAAGFAAGILLAPKSGKETRADIKRKAGDAKEFASEKAGVVKDKATAGFKAAKEGATEVGHEAAGFFGRTSKDAKKTAGVVAEDAKKAGRNVRDAVK